MTSELPKGSDLAGNRVVVTGAAGFIGAALVDRLVNTLGCEVLGIDNERSGDWARVDTSCERDDRAIESLTVDDWTHLMAGSSVVFHLAAEKYNSSKSTPERVLDTNVNAFQRLIRGAQGVEDLKVIFTSSLYAYGSLGPELMSESDVLDPTTLYGASKAMSEYMLRAGQRDSNLRWSVARLFFIYGPRQYAEGGYKSVILKNFERIHRGEPPIIFGDGRQSLDYVYVDDCVNALVAMADRQSDGLVANVASGSPVDVNELTAVMLEVSGAGMTPVHGEPDWTAGSSRGGRPDLIESRVGWHPEVDLRTGVRRVWEWIEGRG